MENWEIEKDYNGAIDKESVISLSSLQLPNTVQTTSIDILTDVFLKEKEIDKDEKAQRHYPKRSGATEWVVDGSGGSHIHDSLVYDIDDLTETGRPSMYEVTQQRDQTLYEKASCSSDVIRVWNQLSRFIKSQLRQGIGVTIPGLGTFTVALTKRSSFDETHFLLKRKPLFILSKVLTKRYKLIDPSESFCAFRAPATLVNLTEVALKAKVCRSIVEGVVTEVLQTFSRALACNKPIEFPFPYIGKLQIHNHQPIMRFYADYYKNMNYDLDPGQIAQLSSIPAYKGIATKLSSLNIRMSAYEPMDYYTFSDILPGHMTPLHTHIPTESFRSVFHLREVRSVSEIIAVTQEELRQVSSDDGECLPKNDNNEQPSSNLFNNQLPKIKEQCRQITPDFNWCQVSELDGEEENTEFYQNSFLGELEGEGEEDYMRKWIQPIELQEFNKKEQIEYEGEDDLKILHSGPVTPPPSNRSILTDEIVEMSPKSFMKDSSVIKKNFDLVPKVLPPCHHDYQPQPLYLIQPSGNIILDMVLLDKVRLNKILSNHHHQLCTELLGIQTIKKHYKNKVTNRMGKVTEVSSFHNF